MSHFKETVRARRKSSWLHFPHIHIVTGHPKLQDDGRNFKQNIFYNIVSGIDRFLAVTVYSLQFIRYLPAQMNFFFFTCEHELCNFRMFPVSKRLVCRKSKAELFIIATFLPSLVAKMNSYSWARDGFLAIYSSA